GSTSRASCARSTRFSASTASSKIRTTSCTPRVSLVTSNSQDVNQLDLRPGRVSEAEATQVVRELARVPEEQPVGGGDEGHAVIRHPEQQLAAAIDAIDSALGCADELSHLREGHPCRLRG